MAAHKVASALAAGAPTILKPSEYAPYGTTELGPRSSTGVLADAGRRPGRLPARPGRLRRRRPRWSATRGSARSPSPVASVGGRADRRGLRRGLHRAAARARRQQPARRAARRRPGRRRARRRRPADHAQRPVVPGPGPARPARRTGPTRSSTSRSSRLAALGAGDPLDPATDLGPIVHSQHLGRLRGADRRPGGRRAARRTRRTPRARGPGSFLAPTLLTGVPSEAALEEIFGPVATVHTYETEDEALALANAHAVRPRGLRRRRRPRARAGLRPPGPRPARSRSTAPRS